MDNIEKLANDIKDFNCAYTGHQGTSNALAKHLISIGYNLFSPPPVVGDLRLRLAEFLCNKQMARDYWDFIKDTDKPQYVAQKLAFLEQADSILNIIKEAGYVKLAKGDKLICKTAWDLLSPMVTKGIEVANKESGWRKIA